MTYLSEFVNDKLAQSDTKDLPVVVDAVIEWLNRAGYLKNEDVKIIAHKDAELKPRRPNPPLSRR
jgi:hypothetical protein